MFSVPLSRNCHIVPRTIPVFNNYTLKTGGLRSKFHVIDMSSCTYDYVHRYICVARQFN